jgi:hypothetical protein
MVLVTEVPMLAPITIGTACETLITEKKSKLLKITKLEEKNGVALDQINCH